MLSHDGTFPETASIGRLQPPTFLCHREPAGEESRARLACYLFDSCPLSTVSPGNCRRSSSTPADSARYLVLPHHALDMTPQSSGKTRTGLLSRSRRFARLAMALHSRGATPVRCRRLISCPGPCATLLPRPVLPEPPDTSYAPYRRQPHIPPHHRVRAGSARRGRGWLPRPSRPGVARRAVSGFAIPDFQASRRNGNHAAHVHARMGGAVADVLPRAEGPTWVQASV